MTFARTTLWIIGLATLGFGGLAFARPALVAELVGWQLLGPGALTEIRAFYGGAEFGLAVFWIIAAATGSMLRPALLAAVAVWSLVGLSRLAGVLIDDSFSNFMLAAMISEFGAAAFALIALRRLPASAPTR